MEWPDGFLWGTGASSTQCEGAAPASDWFAWEQAGRVPVSGDGNGFAERYAEDFRTYAALGLTQHRLSIEWARIEPEPGRHDQAAIDHYRAVLHAADDAGVQPWVCLHHFTLPQWFAEAGAFVPDANRMGAWAHHVDFVAETFGDLVAGWKPMNEPNIHSMLGYQLGLFPPGRQDRDIAEPIRAITLANAEAAARLRQTGAPVASVFSLSTYEALDDTDATHALVDRLYAEMWEPGLGLFRDGVLRVPGIDPIERPDLAGTFDLIGFSYYSAIGVRDGRIVVHPADAPVSPLGYGIWADGLALVLDRLHVTVPGTPLLIAEYGIGTADDAKRAEYVERGLEITGAALARGVDVRGFFHWTGVDNYEWVFGYDVEFGLIDRDRTVRPSAAVLQREALERS